jgi:hypothetical protein
VAALALLAVVLERLGHAAEAGRVRRETAETAAKVPPP